MKHLITLLSASIAFTAASAAPAPQGAATPAQTLAPSPVQVSANNPYKLPFDEARTYQGQYSLSNGKTLTVSRRGQRLFADVVGDEDVELVAIAQGAFVTADGKTRLNFQQAANGNVFGVQLQTRAAQMAQNTVVMAAESFR